MTDQKETDWEGVYWRFFSFNKESNKFGFHNKLVIVQT